MSRKIGFLMVLALTFFSLHCATMRNVSEGARIGAVMGLPTVESPLLRDLGFIIPPNRIVVVNNIKTCTLYASLAIYDKSVTTLGPGDIAYNRDFWELFQEVEVGLIARFYSDAAMTAYVGVASQKMRTYRNYYGGASSSWVIAEDDVQTPSGKPVCSSLVAPVTRLEIERVKFSREWLNGTTGIQFVNNDPEYNAYLSVDGKPIWIDRRDNYKIGPNGSMTYIRLTSIPGWENYRGGEVNLLIQFTDKNNVLRGTMERRVWIPPDGVWVEQIIASRHDL